MSQSTATFQASLLECIQAGQALEKALAAAVPAMKEDDAALAMEALENWRTALQRLGGDAETAVADRIRRDAALAVEHQDTVVAVKDTAPGQNTCTVHHPYERAKDDRSQQWSHPSATCVYDGDDYDRYECPICGLLFKVELGQ